MKVSRREAIRYLCGGLAGSALISALGCSRNDAIVSVGEESGTTEGPPSTPLFSVSSLQSAKDLVQEYHSASMGGELLRGPSRFRDRVIPSRETDSIMIIEDSSFDRIAVLGGKTCVVMRARHRGMIRGLAYYPYNPRQGGDGYVRLRYEIAANGADVCVRAPVPHLISTQAAINHFRQVLDDCRSAARSAAGGGMAAAVSGLEALVSALTACRSGG